MATDNGVAFGEGQLSDFFFFWCCGENELVDFIHAAMQDGEIFAAKFKAEEMWQATHPVFALLVQLLGIIAIPARRQKIATTVFGIATITIG